MEDLGQNRIVTPFRDVIDLGELASSAFIIRQRFTHFVEIGLLLPQFRPEIAEGISSDVERLVQVLAEGTNFFRDLLNS